MRKADASRCEHPRRQGCVYCPTCGDKFASQRQQPSGGCLSWLLAPIYWVARIYSPVYASPQLDVGANLEQIRTGDPEKIRRALGFLLKLAPHAREIRPVIEALQDHKDRDIALRARDVLAAMGPE